MDRLKTIVARQNLKLLAVLLIALGIIVTVYLARQQQEIRKRAQDEGSLTFPNNPNNTTTTQNVRVKLTFNQSGAPTVTPTITGAPTPTPTQPAAGTIRRVFVTSTSYSGNLGGLGDADAKCQDRASAASLGGTWKAWLSSQTVSAASRMNHSPDLPYKLLNGMTVADNWGDLTDGSIDNAISINELSNATTGVTAWTHTKADGTSQGSFTVGAGLPVNACADWTSAASGSTPTTYAAGGTGVVQSATAAWTYTPYSPGALYTIARCDFQQRLYCFEQTTSANIPVTPIPTSGAPTPTSTPTPGAPTATPTPTVTPVAPTPVGGSCTQNMVCSEDGGLTKISCGTGTCRPVPGSQAPYSVWSCDCPP